MRLVFCLAILLSQFPFIASVEAQFGSPTKTFGVSEELQATLKKRVSLQFKDETLYAAIDKLLHAHGVKYLIHTPSLEDTGFNLDQKVSLSIENKEIGEALSQVLSKFDIGFVTSGNIVEITSKNYAENAMVTRVYNVTDLLLTGTDSQIVMTKSVRSDINDIGDLLVSHVDPSSWLEEGGNGSVSPVKLGDKARLLVITQRPRNHALIEQMFAEMRTKLAAKEKQAADLHKEDPVTVRVYRIISENMSVEDCSKLLKTVFEKVDWEQDNSLKIIGETLVLKQQDSVHNQVYQLLNDLGLLRPAKGK